MSIEQLVRNLLERAVDDGIVFPATNCFDDPDPQARSDEELKDLSRMVLAAESNRGIQARRKEAAEQYLTTHRKKLEEADMQP